MKIRKSCERCIQHRHNKFAKAFHCLCCSCISENEQFSNMTREWRLMLNDRALNTWIELVPVLHWTTYANTKTILKDAISTEASHAQNVFFSYFVSENVQVSNMTREWRPLLKVPHRKKGERQKTRSKHFTNLSQKRLFSLILTLTYLVILWRQLAKK